LAELPLEPKEAAELDGLEAELREAIQHRRAALERVRETQAELERLIERAKRLIAEREGSAPPR
jgi:hypothetical protein